MLGDPEWGCYLIDRVFQYNGVIVNQLIVEDIMEAVRKYEPRIILTEQDITIINEVQKVSIYMTYTIKETGEVNEYNLEITADDNPINT